MLGDAAEGGPPCWMLVGDVGWVLVGSWLFVFRCSFLFNGEVQKEGCTQVGFVLLSFPFPFAFPPSFLQANGRFFQV